MGRLLDQLGLKPLARSALAASSAATAQAPASAKGMLGTAPAAAGSKPGRAPQGKMELGGASIEKLSLGPPVEGPDLNILWALLAEDGSGPLDSSNSHVGARLNEHGRELMLAFPRVRATERKWFDQQNAVTALSIKSQEDLHKMYLAVEAIGKRATANADVRSNSEAYVKALRGVEKVMRDIAPKTEALHAAVARVRAAGQQSGADAAQRKVQRTKDEIDEEKERAEKLKKRLGGLLDLAVKGVTAEWADIALDAAKFVGEQLIDQIPEARMEDLKKELKEATTHLYELQDDVRASELEAVSSDLKKATEELENVRQDVRDALDDLALAQTTVVKTLAASPATADAARMIAERSKMLKMLTETKTAVGRYQSEVAPLLVEVDKIAVLYRGFPSLMKQMPGVDVNGKWARSLAATTKENTATLESWGAFIRDGQAAAKKAIGLLSNTGNTGYMMHFNRIEEVLQGALANR